MPKKYTEEDKQRAIANYLVFCNMVQVSKITGIPRSTLMTWTKSEWWVNKITIARIEQNQKLDAKFTNIIEKATYAIEDRIENGDFRLNKKEELLRVPMTGRDLSIVTGVTFDKRNLQRGQPTSITENIDTETRLEKLANQIRAVSQKTIEGQCVLVSEGGE